MRIVHTTFLSPWDERHGGGQLIVHDLSAALARRGNDVHAIYSGVRPNPFPDLPYRAHFVPHHEKMYLNPPEFRRGAGDLDEPADVVHSHGYEGALLGEAVVPGALRVATSHHPDPPDLRSPPPWWRPVSRTRWTHRNLLGIMERRALRQARLLIATSEHSERLLRERYGLNPDLPGTVVHNGARPLPVASSAEDDADAEEDLDLLFVGRLDHHKGVDVLIEALALMEDDSASLDFVGTGLLEAELRRHVSRLGLDDRVRFRGYMSGERLAALYRAARVQVVPSRWENFPLVVLEGLHAGNAMVATRVGGIPEAVRHEKEALLVPPDDAPALARALDRILADRGLARRLTDRARTRASEFTWERAAERVEAAYLRALNR